MARRIGVVSTARSDFGPLLPLLRVLHSRADVELLIYAGGTHFSPVNDYSIAEVEGEFPDCTVRVPCEIGGDGPLDIALAMADVLAGYARALSDHPPDILVVLGDRYDMMPAVAAAMPFNIPIAHLCGGEVTEGVIDDAIRHAVTKLSHLHFPTNEIHGRRLAQLGEEDCRIHVTGESGLDMFQTMTVLPKDEVYGEFGFDPARLLTILTYHPETIGFGEVAQHVAEVLEAARSVSETQLLITHPNSDTGSSHILAAIHAFAEGRKDCVIVPSLGKRRYFQFLHHVDCLVGNSSSGIIEAASVFLPVVNIGARQQGRIAPRNVITTPIECEPIARAWRAALSSTFREGLRGLINPYGDGHSSQRIAQVLATAPLENIFRKKFADWPTIDSDASAYLHATMAESRS
jgi:UDP-N-acetylglucosamine 2-epimerase (non-hydrolysing)